MYPETYKYTNDHEWFEPATGRMGITDYAQKQLGDIVFLELPEIGRTVKKGEQIGTVESVKAVSEIFAPMSGTIAQVNAGLVEKPESINQDAHGSWMVVITPSVAAEAQQLLDAAQYSELTK
jgi:glycine cleavage system H protein